jgi:hypothetical protein
VTAGAGGGEDSIMPAARRDAAGVMDVQRRKARSKFVTFE